LSILKDILPREPPSPLLKIGVFIYCFAAGKERFEIEIEIEIEIVLSRVSGHRVDSDQHFLKTANQWIRV
jgi:hypothetical protein